MYVLLPLLPSVMGIVHFTAQVTLAQWERPASKDLLDSLEPVALKDRLGSLDSQVCRHLSSVYLLFSVFVTVMCT